MLRILRHGTFLSRGSTIGLACLFCGFGSSSAPADDSGSTPAAAAEATPGLTPLNLTEIVDHVQQSVVVITFSGRDGVTQGLGTGFILREDGLIATNLHVIGEARPIQVRTFDGAEYEVQSIHAHEHTRDLAILRIDADSGQLAGPPRPLAQQVDDPAPGGIGQRRERVVEPARHHSGGAMSSGATSRTCVAKVQRCPSGSRAW